MTARRDRLDNASVDERFEQLVELAPDAILVHDGKRVVLANASAVRLAGATRRAQLVGLSIDTILDPPHLKAIESQLTDSSSLRAVAPPVRDTLHRLDGADLEVEVRAVGFLDHGRPSAHLVVRDITERLAAEQAARQLDERLHEVQRMELVGALAGGVAHEVNNMLQVIMGFGDFLLRDERVPEEATADVREIMKAANRAGTVTRQLLAFSRRAAYQPELLDLGGAVREARPVLDRLLGGDVQIDMTVGSTPDVTVDADQLQQVILNLALNARDAMPDGGTLTLTTEDSRVPAGMVAADGRLIPGGRYATLRVSDTGLGMDAAVRARIFEPFFTTKPTGRGTGLGLAAVLGVLGQNHGFITVTSTQRKGSTFTVYLPAATNPPPANHRVGPQRGRTEYGAPSGSILVVDDEDAVRAVAARILQREGYRVLQASGGNEALELIERLGPPDLLLTDVMMPGLNGIGLAQAMQARYPAVPIIFMSGYSSEELARLGTPITAARLLSKPFAPGELTLGVAAMLSRTGGPTAVVKAD